jgi:hypothetical protein
MKFREQYQVKISNWFAPSSNKDYDVDINRAWESIRENITALATEILGYGKLKQLKP